MYSEQSDKNRVFKTKNDYKNIIPYLKGIVKCLLSTDIIFGARDKEKGSEKVIFRAKTETDYNFDTPTKATQNRCGL